MKNAADPCGKAARTDRAEISACNVIPLHAPRQIADERISPWLRRVAPHMRSARDWQLLHRHRARVAARLWGPA